MQFISKRTLCGHGGLKLSGSRCTCYYFPGHTTSREDHGDQVRASVSEGQPPVGAFVWLGMTSVSHSSLCVVHRHLSACARGGKGEDKICCGNRDFATHPCKPASCPISSGSGLDYLPAMPFHAAIVDGKCRCCAPQVCDE